MTFGRFAEDFVVGQTYRHPIRKTVTESDNNLFCLLTMNHHPLHIDAEFAASTRFGERVVVGTLVLSLAVGISVPDLSAAAIAALGYDKVRHLSPVHIGDTLSVESEIMSVRTTSDASANVIVVLSTVLNQKSERVLVFERSFLVPQGRAANV